MGRDTNFRTARSREFQPVTADGKKDRKAAAKISFLAGASDTSLFCAPKLLQDLYSVYEQGYYSISRKP